MDIPTKAGEVRTQPDSEVEIPVAKKPRLEGKPKALNPNKNNKRTKSRKGKKFALPELCSSEDVLWRDIITVVGKEVVDQSIEEGTEFDTPFGDHEEAELVVDIISSSGTCLVR